VSSRLVDFYLVFVLLVDVLAPPYGGRLVFLPLASELEEACVLLTTEGEELEI
jgi:hypothetical protein